MGPLGKVSHYFWRYEYQARGAPHIHALIWIEGSPILKEDLSNEEEVKEFIDQHITCRLPDEGDTANAQLRNLVLQFQNHNSCTGSCIRTRRCKRSGRKTMFCRFGFPRPVAKETTLRTVKSSVKSKLGTGAAKKLYDLKRSRLEERINDFNPTLLLAWEAK